VEPHDLVAKMAALIRLRQAIKQGFVPTLLVAVTSYFVWSTVHGERGLESSDDRQQRLATAQSYLSRMQQEQDAWESKVAGLRTRSLDLDALDASARRVLNVAHPADVVFILRRDAKGAPGTGPSDAGR
jgi:cell division protein FtsB